MAQLPPIKQLVSETVIYGVSSVLGRAVSFLLLPLYTGVFTTAEFGIQTLIYVYGAVLFVFYLMRFDTAYFRFASDSKWKTQSFNTAFCGVAIAAVTLSLLLFGTSDWLAEWVFNIGGEYQYILKILAGILLFDALAEIPYARLRLEKKAIRFASLRLLNIFINVGLNCFFYLFLPWYTSRHPSSSLFDWYNADLGIGYIFISNLVASLSIFILLYPEWKNARWQFDRKLIGEMWKYAAPLMFVALAGIINEMLDRALLDRLLPFDDDANKAQAGIYSAAYKFAILIALFTQAYRYAAEPFFFAHAKNNKSPKLYAQIAEYFVLAGCVGFLSIMFFLPILKQIMRNDEYHEGVVVVPILIMANILLGIYYNLAIWYKLTDKTKYAMYIAFGGAGITILLNVIFIPILGYLGSAWATFICFLCMTLASYFIGKRHYPLEHSLPRMASMMVLSSLTYYGVFALIKNSGIHALFANLIYAGVIIGFAFVGFQYLQKRRVVA